MDKAVTRGNGVIGEVVTNNARVFVNLPLKIPYQGELILRGEALITTRISKRLTVRFQKRKPAIKTPEICAAVRSASWITVLRPQERCVFTLLDW